MNIKSQNIHHFCDVLDHLSYVLVLAGPSLISREGTSKVGLLTFSTQNKQNKLPKRSAVFVAETREIDNCWCPSFMATLMTEPPGSLK